jgi:hypothetical protein
MYLFYRNKHVAMHNNHMLSLMPGDEIMISAIDMEEDNHGDMPFHQHTTTFPMLLVLKFNMLVEIYACNYDSQDGLVNGADGVVKAYTKTYSTDVLWIRFHDPLIGH